MRDEYASKALRLQISASESGNAVERADGDTRARTAEGTRISWNWQCFGRCSGRCLCRCSGPRPHHASSWRLSNLVYFCVKMRNQPENAGEGSGGMEVVLVSRSTAWHPRIPLHDHSTPYAAVHSHRTVHAPMYLDISYSEPCHLLLSWRYLDTGTKLGWLRGNGGVDESSEILEFLLAFPASQRVI